MYVNFLSTYSDKKSCHTSTTLQTSIPRSIRDSWASCFYRAMICVAPTMPSQDLTVCLSVARWYFVETVVHILKRFTPYGNHTILAVLTKRYGNILRRGPPNGASKARGMKKPRFSTNRPISYYLGNDAK